jgi:hypothetical protein
MERPPPPLPCLGAPPPSPQWPDLCRLEDRFFPCPICSFPSAQARYASISHNHRRSSSQADFSVVLFVNHAPERGPYAPASGSNAPERAAHALPRVRRCAAQSPLKLLLCIEFFPLLLLPFLFSLKMFWS